MMLRVVYTDGSFDLVNDFMLSLLIQSRKVTKFNRSSGWVDVDSQYVRREGNNGSYSGPERIRL
jgi:hypothetical protein